MPISDKLMLVTSRVMPEDNAVNIQHMGR